METDFVTCSMLVNSAFVITKIIKYSHTCDYRTADQCPAAIICAVGGLPRCNLERRGDLFARRPHDIRKILFQADALTSPLQRRDEIPAGVAAVMITTMEKVGLGKIEFGRAIF